MFELGAPLVKALGTDVCFSRTWERCLAGGADLGVGGGAGATGVGGFRGRHDVVYWTYSQRSPEQTTPRRLRSNVCENTKMHWPRGWARKCIGLPRGFSGVTWEGALIRMTIQRCKVASVNFFGVIRSSCMAWACYGYVMFQIVGGGGYVVRSAPECFSGTLHYRLVGYAIRRCLGTTFGYARLRHSAMRGYDLR